MQYKITNTIKYLLLILLLFIPFREILSLYLGNYIKIISDLIVIVIFLISVFNKKIKLEFKKIDIIFILFLIIGFISTIFINKYNLSTYIIQIRSIAIYYILYFILRNYKFKKDDLNLFNNALKIIAIVLFVLSITEIIFNKMILFPKQWATSIRYADNYLRSYSLFNNPNSFAIFTLFTYIFLNEFDNKNNYLINILLTVSILLTMSRSTILFFVIYLAYNFFKKNYQIKKKLIPIICGIIVALSVNVLKNAINYDNSRQNTIDDEIAEELKDDYHNTEISDSLIDRFGELKSKNILNSSSYNGRIYSILKGLEIFLDHPLIGTGFGSYGSSASFFTTSKIYEHYDIREDFYADNDYIKVLVETGLIGFIIYILFCLLLILENKKSIIIILIFLGYGLFINNFETQALTFLFYLIISINFQNTKSIEKK